jgi:soluble lytic murein transglycosylase
VLGFRLIVHPAAVMLGVIVLGNILPDDAGILMGVFAGVVVGGAHAESAANPIPLPRQRPGTKSTSTTHAAQKPAAQKSAPLSIAPLAPASAAPTNPAASVSQMPMVPQVAAMRPAPPFATATTLTTSPIDLTAVKQAIDLVGKNRQDEATNVESTITDPLARKLVEWVILRSEDGSGDFSRYVSFIAANPSWPSIGLLRRRAEAVMWQQQVDPQAAIDFFAAEPPHTAKGHFALARALLAKGDTAGAAATLRASWRSDGFSADLEDQARQSFAGLITPADDQARMDARLYAEDDDAGLRAAHHLDSTALAVAKARAAVINEANNAKALLEAVPQAARHDPGYMFSRIQWLRRQDKIPEAAQLMLAVAHDPAMLVDVDQWWVERRLIARKLLDLGDARTAYEIANGAVAPANENYRAEQHFTAGWIALRFLHQPAIALAHFARIGDGTANPITLARSFYWQGRAAEALGRDDARGFYEAAAHYPTAYYGQLARARLGLDEMTLRALPEPAPAQQPLEIARVFEILYAIDNRDLVAAMAAEIGDKATDTGAMATFADIAVQHNDARATLLIGKAALSRGLPFERYAFPVFGVPAYQPIGPEVEPCVVYSIVRQESAFNPQVVSSANAIGLMQVTPDAGRDTAKRFGVAFDRHRLADDVVYNAQLGTAELGNDIASWRGSYILAFVAYNAGPRRAKEWIEQYGDPRDANMDPIDWVERIPIAETRNYVERVIENMQVYRALVENNPKLSIEADLRRGGS